MQSDLRSSIVSHDVDADQTSEDYQVLGGIAESHKGMLLPRGRNLVVFAGALGVAALLLLAALASFLRATIIDDGQSPIRLQTYIPGTPGSRWTEQEALDVYTKLRIITNHPAALVKQSGLDKKAECYTETQIVFSERAGSSEASCERECTQTYQDRCSSFFFEQSTASCKLFQHQPCSHVKNWAQHMGVDPFMPMYLRLGFHVCVPYEDGTGGCDGCVSTEDMFVRYIRQKNGKPFHTRPAERKGSNGNMHVALDMLEKIYTDPHFPPGSPVLNGGKSLKDTGKSRADLYAFAAIAAVNWGFTNNNIACVTGENLYKVMGGISFPCNVTLERPLAFKSGRKDCLKKDRPQEWKCDDSCKGGDSLVRDQGCKGGFYRCKMQKKCMSEACRGCGKCLPPWDGSHKPRPWESVKKQRTPPSWLNGSMLSDFFNINFGFNKQEAVAIMGAHGIGDFHSETSGGFRYMWTQQQDTLLNNLYYRVISLAPSKLFQSGVTSVLGHQGLYVPAQALGGVHGQMARSRLFLHKGGEEVPYGGIFQWFHQYERCPLCKDGKVVDYKFSSWSYQGKSGDVCCSLCLKATKAITDIGQNRVIYNDVEGLTAEEELQFEEHKCVQFISTHETLLTADIGLHRAVEITAGGRPANCDQSRGQTCPLNELQDVGGKKMHEIVEMYMNDQNLWANHFVDVLEKMLANGVREPLVTSFDFGSIGDVVCDRSSGPFKCSKHGTTR
eukprot:TRINITY_DN9484_c0_g1_i1.p1 TRINITY_DN9484_c0_g1~~TRINITY_DN9484_c0_g1_i1.p1  ORF type:complete len:728 (-),score=46.92 TRINITY_DN9484_c0_g1_i1:137-2320(-)